MNISFLGTNGFPTGKRKTIGTLIEHDNKKMMLECGASFLQELEAENFLVTDLDFIFSSHVHADHSSGIPMIFFANIMERLYKKWNSGKTHLFLALEQDTYDVFLPVIKHAYAPFFTSTPPSTVELFPIPNDKYFEFEYEAGIKICTTPVKHSVSNIGIQVRWDDFKITYISDTNYFDELIEFSTNSDLIICNIFGSSKYGATARNIGFMTSIEAALLAKKSNSKKLALQHIFFPEDDLAICQAEANAIFPNTILPDNGDRIVIS
jgi:ribonuclease BN (tRNA processing enzyme)